MNMDVGAVRRQFQANLPAANAQPGQARSTDGVQFKSNTDAWKPWVRGLAKATVVPWLIAKAMGKTEGRVQLSVRTLGVTTFDSGVTKSEFKKLKPPEAGANDAVSQAKDQQVRSIAIKLIKATGQDNQLQAVWQECSTADLVELARDCAKDPTGDFREAVFNTLREQLATANEAPLSPELRGQIEHYKANKLRLDERMQFQPAAPSETDRKMAEVKTSMDATVMKNPLVKNFFEVTLKAKPSEMLELRNFASKLAATQHLSPPEQTAYFSQLLKDSRPQVVLLMTFPELGQLFGLPEGLGKALQDATGLRPETAMGTSYAGLRDAIVGGVLDQLQQEGVSGLPSREDLKLPAANLTSKPGLKDFLKTGYWAQALVSLDARLAKPATAQALGGFMDRFSQDFQFGALMAPLKNMAVESQGQFKGFIEEILGKYFDAQPLQDRKAMLAAMYQMPPGALPQMVGILRGSGPYMQKLLQQFGDKVKDPQVKELLDQLKTGLNPIDETQRRALLANILEQPGLQGATLLDVASVSAASVAEAVACRIQKPGQEPQEFIIKLLRPGIEQRAGRERAYFEDVASRYEGISGTYATVADQIEGELDLRREAEQVSQGQVYTQAGRDGVQSMRLAEGFAPQKNALIIERAPGQTVKSFIESTRASNLSAEQRLALIEEGRGLASNLSKLTGVWLKEVVYGSGFYHGDMHAGNILTHSEQGVTLIDFGNAGQIPPGEQRSFLLFQAALLKNKPGTAVEALAGLLPPLARSKFDEARNVIRAEVAQLMVKEARGELKQELAFAVVDALNKRGIEMPPAFVNLCRAQDMVQQALNQVAGRVDALITQAGDPKPAGCDRLEVDREVEQAISGSTRSLVGKLGVIKSLQLSQFTPASTLLADMRKLPDVVSGMNAYESKRLVYDEALQAHKAELGIFESRQDVMNAESEPGNERLGIHNRLYQHYEAEKVSDFPSVPENLRADLRRLVFEPKEVTALDFTPLTTLIDAMDPALMPKLRQADDALAALLVDRPKEPPKPAPVYEEDLYLEAIKAGSREPQAIAPLGLPAGVAPHVELVNLELQPA